MGSGLVLPFFLCIFINMVNTSTFWARTLYGLCEEFRGSLSVDAPRKTWRPHFERGHYTAFAKNSEVLWAWMLRQRRDVHILSEDTIRPLRRIQRFSERGCSEEDVTSTSWARTLYGLCEEFRGSLSVDAPRKTWRRKMIHMTYGKSNANHWRDLLASSASNQSNHLLVFLMNLMIFTGAGRSLCLLLHSQGSLDWALAEVVVFLMYTCVVLSDFGLHFFLHCLLQKQPCNLRTTKWVAKAAMCIQSLKIVFI